MLAQNTSTVRRVKKFRCGEVPERGRRARLCIAPLLPENRDIFCTSNCESRIQGRLCNQCEEVHFCCRETESCSPYGHCLNSKHDMLMHYLVVVLFLLSTALLLVTRNSHSSVISVIMVVVVVLTIMCINL